MMNEEDIEAMAGSHELVFIAESPEELAKAVRAAHHDIHLARWYFADGPISFAKDYSALLHPAPTDYGPWWELRLARRATPNTFGDAHQALCLKAQR